MVANTVQKRLRIAFLTSLDPQDRRSWSGTIYHVAQALQKHCGDITYIGPIDCSRQKTIGKIRNRVAEIFLKKKVMFTHGTLIARHCAKVAARRLAQQPFDLIVAPTGETEIAFLQTDLPIVLVTDSTYRVMRDYYPAFSRILDSSFRELELVASSAIQKSSLLLYASQWAADSAIEDYQASPEKVHVIPFGANFESTPPIEILQQRKRSDRCKLLFIGVKWERKGGDIAFETLLALEKMGIEAVLTVVGCIPPKQFAHPSMKVIPFLNKNDESQRKELEELYLTSDFLLFPTRNECYGIVVCEANAFGLPAIAADTGGVSGVVTEGVNGFLLPHSARGEQYAEIVAKLYQDEQSYAALVRSSRADFDARLNWDVWGATAHTLMMKLLEREEKKDVTLAAHHI
ncbi:MAG TPA: glycosyltransferase family 4 protein [Ktedonobacteraceae bacterium]|nr:glycosyltransferase family 4 protein [Ktedonobacteraceae bacterium]